MASVIDNPKKEIGLIQHDFGEISAFHQGAGEASILNIIMKSLQEIPQNSLLIIDEVENSLHPSAQRYLMQVLLEYTLSHRLQIILTTHSPYILEELPEEARILLAYGQNRSTVNIITRPSIEYAFSRIDNKRHPELYAHVEDKDDIAKIFLEEILSSSDEGQSVLNRVEILSVGKDSVVETLSNLASQSKLPYKSVSFIDGGRKITDDGNIFQLPGQYPPEKTVLFDLRGRNWKPLEEYTRLPPGELFDRIEKIINENDDHHPWIRKIADYFKRSKSTLWREVVRCWCDNCLQPDDRDRIINIIKQHLK